MEVLGARNQAALPVVKVLLVVARRVLQVVRAVVVVPLRRVLLAPVAKAHSRLGVHHQAVVAARVHRVPKAHRVHSQAQVAHRPAV